MRDPREQAWGTVRGGSGRHRGRGLPQWRYKRLLRRQGSSTPASQGNGHLSVSAASTGTLAASVQYPSLWPSRRFRNRYSNRNVSALGSTAWASGRVCPGRRGERRLSAAHTGPVNVEANPDQVHGCAKCLELAEEDLQDENDYRGHCLHCRREIAAHGGVEWRRAIRMPCPHCGRSGW